MKPNKAIKDKNPKILPIEQLTSLLKLKIPLYNKTLLHSLFGMACLLCIAQFDPGFFNLLISTMADAYIGVSVFVAATLAGFYLLSNLIKPKLIEKFAQNQIIQVSFAAFLGALPGCGGAIIVVTHYVSGKMSFGALVAVLVSTMGDAAFLLIATKPDVALLVYSIGLCTGIISGLVLNAIHGVNYLRPKQTKQVTQPQCELPKLPQLPTHLFILMIIPGLFLGIAEAMQFDSNQIFGSWASAEPTKWFGFLGSSLCILIWFSQPLNSWSARFTHTKEIKHIQETVVAETSFITVWVVLGFLCYEMLVYFLGLDLKSFFTDLGGLTILFAVLVGFIPGCGPQIVVTTLYLNGVIPFSAQLANAISNDGDALFPAIAMAPKAAFRATIYSAIPALVLGYLFYFLTESNLN